MPSTRAPLRRANVRRASAGSALATAPRIVGPDQSEDFNRIRRQVVGGVARMGSTMTAHRRDGSVIELPSKDVQIAVHGLITAVLPVLLPRPVVAGMFAAQGGAARTKVKAATARENGKKGGRPRKSAA